MARCSAPITHTPRTSAARSSSPASRSPTDADGEVVERLEDEGKLGDESAAEPEPEPEPELATARTRKRGS